MQYAAGFAGRSQKCLGGKKARQKKLRNSGIGEFRNSM
jgi:hypothetical protein